MFIVDEMLPVIYYIMKKADPVRQNGHELKSCKHFIGLKPCNSVNIVTTLKQKMFYNEQFVFIKWNFCLLVLPYVLCHPLLTLNNVS